MKKSFFLAAAVAFLGTLPIVGYRSAPARAEGVWVCHFPRHQGPHSGDFVTFNAPPRTTVCDSEGGIPIYVDPEGCINGHQATPRFGKDCWTDDQD